MTQFVTYLIHNVNFFLSFRSIVKSDSYVKCASVLSVCLSAWNKSTGTQRIFMKFDIRDFLCYKLLCVNDI